MKRVLILGLFAGILGLSAHRAIQRWGDPRLHVWFFDVHQGDAALIQFPFGKTWLVDAGGGYGEWNVGERVLLKELAALNVLHLDVALLTHPDRDHAFGFFGIFDHFGVGEFWYNAAFGFPRARHSMLRSLLQWRDSMDVVAWKRSARFTYSDVEVTVYPPHPDPPSKNDRSLLVLLAFAGHRVLLTGDIHANTEKQLPAWGPLTVLKIAHHGSQTSSSRAFLKKNPPRYAINSSGYGNRYGHPHTEVLERFRKFDSRILRTDYHGYVHFTFWPNGKFTCDCGRGAC